MMNNLKKPNTKYTEQEVRSIVEEIREVEKVMINYKDEFKKYDDALTADMVEMEGYGQD